MTTAIIIPHEIPAPSVEIIPVTLAAQAEAVLAEAAITVLRPKHAEVLP
jgi:hypothetical protein